MFHFFFFAVVYCIYLSPKIGTTFCSVIYFSNDKMYAKVCKKSTTTTRTNTIKASTVSSLQLAWSKSFASAHWWTKLLLNFERNLWYQIRWTLFKQQVKRREIIDKKQKEEKSSPLSILYSTALWFNAASLNITEWKGKEKHDKEKQRQQAHVGQIIDLFEILVFIFFFHYLLSLLTKLVLHFIYISLLYFLKCILPFNQL